MVDTHLDELDTKSIRSYGIHGALGLWMGIGAGFILSEIIPVFAAVYPLIGPAILGATVLIIYSFYIGYIFGGHGKSSRLSISGAAAGAFGGLITGGLLAGDFIRRSSLLDPLFITLAFAGLIFGLPKVRSMLLLAASSASGAAIGYGVYALGQNITVYLNNAWAQGGLLLLFIAILFSLFATGIAGASIAIGIYFTEGTAYTAREVPGFLKVTRSTGIILTLFVLFASTLMFLSVAKYATTDVSIGISPGNGNLTIYTPVLLENGQVMEMYERPVISGSATTEIIDTDHGKVLKISGSGEVEINLKKTDWMLATNPQANDRFLNGFTLSTSNATRYGDVRGMVDAWVYSENDGASFSFSIKRDNGWGRDMRIRTEPPVKLAKGWQAVKLSVTNMMYD